MLDVRISDHITPLVGVLAELLADAPADPFTREWVAVPSIGMRRWLAQRLGRELGTTAGRSDGITANVELPFPGDLRRRVLAADAARRGEVSDPWSAERMSWTVMEVLADPVTRADPLLAPLTTWAEGATLAGRSAVIADLVDRYLLHRPAMIVSWVAGDDVDVVGEPLGAQHRWQPALLRAMRERIAQASPAERSAEIVELARSGSLDIDLPDRVFLFGLSTLPSDVTPLLAAIAQHRQVHGLLLTPSVKVGQDIVAHMRSPLRSGRRRSTAAPFRSRRDHDTSHLVRHPLLRSWGAPSREAVALLGDSGVQMTSVGGIDAQPSLGQELPSVPSGILGRLQSDLRRDAPLPGRDPLSSVATASVPHVLVADDRSIQVHSCTGITRQVEALRDALLHLLAADPSLSEGDIAVLCPRIEELAPVIQAVMGPSAEDDTAPLGDRAPSLRYRITDRSTRSEVPLFGVLSALVTLLPGRFTASEVADFLGLAPVRDRFRLSADDLTRLDEWIEQSHIRWGIDAVHRHRWGLPADFAANSWEAGLDRMLVSTAVRPDANVLTVGDVAPMAVGDAAAVPLARVADAVRTLASIRRRAQGSRTIADWCSLLSDSIEQLCWLPSEESWQRRRLERVFADLLDDSSGHRTGLLQGADGTDAPGSTGGSGSTGSIGPTTSQVLLTLADVRRLLAERIEGEAGRAAFGTGAVAFCSLLPLRSVPHRVVCILGLDADALPRGVTSGDDLLAVLPALGDRDPRAEARQLLLEAVLSAQQALVITCGGVDVRTNAAVPPAVVLDELWDCLAATCALSADEVRDRLQVCHTRQPFDVRNFIPGALIGPSPHGAPPSRAGGGATSWSFDPKALDGAAAALERGDDQTPPVLVPMPLDPPGPIAAVRSLDDLGGFLRDPVGTFLNGRLQVRLPDVADTPSDDLPVALEPLQQWRIGNAFMVADQQQDSNDDVARYLRSSGALPPGVLGADTLAGAEAGVNGMRTCASSLGVDLVAEGVVEVDAPLSDGTVLRGSIPLHHSGDAAGPLLVRYSRTKPHHVLLLASQLFALTVARPDEQWRAVSIHRAPTGNKAIAHDLIMLADSPEERARTAVAALAALVDLWDQGRRMALPLFDRTSELLAHRGWAKAAAGWDAERGEGQLAAVRMAFGERSVDDLRSLVVDGADPREWAERLWGAVSGAVLDRGESLW